MRILIIGGGGREHALALACTGSGRRTNAVTVAPGNAGIARAFACIALEMEDPQAVVKAAHSTQADLVIVGPEAPLAAGAADALRAAGFDVLGPGRDGALLESSKSFAKAFMAKYGIPTAPWRAFRAVEPALKYLRAVGAPVVVKASGLAAGKGVIVAHTLEEAEAGVRSMLEEGTFGESGREVVIEGFLQGEECSFMVLVAGQEYRLFPVSQDHKAAQEGDTGPNTGGMGAYAPAAVATPELRRQVEKTILRPTLHGLYTEGIDYRGILYVGVMLTAEGPQVLEYNVRFGDPECQVLLPLVESDLATILRDCARGHLAGDDFVLRAGHAMTVVLASEGYPGPYPTGRALTLPSNLPPECWLIHAGVGAGKDGQLQTAGGRVLCATARGETLEAAAKLAYSLCDQVCFEGMQYRRDIGHRQLRREGISAD
ncbi:MAG: phosphoribosylamine--glycine ligase [Opitutales bacterium]